MCEIIQKSEKLVIFEKVVNSLNEIIMHIILSSKENNTKFLTKNIDQIMENLLKTLTFCEIKHTTILNN